MTIRSSFYLNKEIRFYSLVSSTNDTLKQWAGEGAPDGAGIVADGQEAGRGSRGRSWISSHKGSLFYSFLWRHPLQHKSSPSLVLSQLSFVSAVAVGRALNRFLEKEMAQPGVDSQGLLAYNRIEYKWPNDILIGGAKGVGILLETSGGTHPDWVVVGIGLNIGEGPLLEDGQKAGALNPTPFENPSLDKRLQWRDDILLFLQEEWDKIRQEWISQGFEKIRQEWLAQVGGLGKPLTARLPQEEKQGIFLGIDEEGRLCLEEPSGKQIKISSALIF